MADPPSVPEPAQLEMAQRQTLAFVCLCFVVPLHIALNRIRWQGIVDGSLWTSRFADSLLISLFQWFGRATLGATLVLLLMQWVRARRAVISFEPLPGLLVGFILLLLVYDHLVLHGIAVVFELCFQASWEQRSPMLYVVFEGLNELFWAGREFVCMWLVLFCARRHFVQRTVVSPPPPTSSRWVALAIALCTTAVTYRLVGSLYTSQFYLTATNLLVLILLGAIAPGMILFFAVCRGLPSYLTRCSLGRVVSASAMLLLLWGSLSGLLCGVWAMSQDRFLLELLATSHYRLLLDLLVQDPNDYLLVLPILYALLWPLSRLSVRLCFGAQASAR